MACDVVAASALRCTVCRFGVPSEFAADAADSPLLPHFPHTPTSHTIQLVGLGSGF